MEGFFEGMNEFASFVRCNNLMDIDLKRFRYTWTNGRRGEANIQAQLDRVIVSQDCVAWFGEASLLGYPKNGSSHNPLLLETLEQRRKFNVPFYFENMWLTHNALEGLVREWWGCRFSRSPLSQIAKNLRFIKKNMKVWSRETFGHLAQRKKEIQIHMNIVEAQIQDSGCLKDLLHLEKYALQEWNTTLE